MTSPNTHRYISYAEGGWYHSFYPDSCYPCPENHPFNVSMALRKQLRGDFPVDSQYRRQFVQDTMDYEEAQKEYYPKGPPRTIDTPKGWTKSPMRHSTWKAMEDGMSLSTYDRKRGGERNREGRESEDEWLGELAKGVKKLPARVAAYGGVEGYFVAAAERKKDDEHEFTGLKAILQPWECRLLPKEDVSEVSNEYTSSVSVISKPASQYFSVGFRSHSAWG